MTDWQECSMAFNQSENVGYRVFGLLNSTIDEYSFSINLQQLI